MTFDDWPWRRWRDERPQAQALRLGDQTLNWRQLCQQVDRLAAGFARQRLQTGDGVLLRAYNHPQTLLAWLALLQCGARVVPVNPQLPRELVSTLLPSLSLRFALLLTDEPGFAGLAALGLREAEGAFAAPWRADRLATMTFTSGSSGLPKAAVHTPGAHLASAEGVLALIPYGDEDDWLLSLPLFHVSGQGILWRWLLAGARMTVRERQPLAQALQGCTHASLVPTQLWRLLNDSAPLSLKSVLLGGAAIAVELAEQSRARGIRTFCGYGLTEFASTVCAKETDGQADVGYPLPGREVRIVDGEIWLRAASQASGYWRDGELIPLVNAQGWFATRDRGELRDGRLTVIGRMDNLFFCGGEGIQPEEVERVIARHPLVAQVFIVPLADREYGQRPVAVIDGREGLVVASLPGWASDKLARFQQPVRWLTLPASVKTGGIKISRRALTQWVNETLKG
ncbi:o-succinylbenzoate--CoA ligase [[Enterobacter] lignolyticus]|uniref:2-succinylbenzoate-CoA ligase n=1 Tax=[Enterobacter] lignolyticus TaxID=1334193 RepID=A0A806X682_9ENTR|nr:o-succinylbenzoate--CoA ligase [[Enterobacter] lignolyticus]ALR77466.1 2-succinylbenzoate-CoA ligase [[Enterobacter] lignolyticus]